MTGRAYPKKEIHKVVASEIARLGYETDGPPLPGRPVVNIDQMSVNNEFIVKGDDDYNITFILDIQTREQSQAQAYEVAEQLRQQLELNIAGYTLQNPDSIFEDCISSEEVDDQGELQREIQRVRLLLTKNT